jgi:RimJ/RimL family protein N-acetyltransferase
MLRIDEIKMTMTSRPPPDDSGNPLEQLRIRITALGDKAARRRHHVGGQSKDIQPMEIETMEEEALGPRLAWRPVHAPVPTILSSRYARVEPVDAERHAHDLFEASHGPDGDPAIWTYLGYGPFCGEAAFRSWLTERARSSDPLFFAILDAASGRAAGMASYLRIAPGDGVIEIGHIWLAPRLQDTRQATEAIFLMARHAFDDLGYRRFEWKCNAGNEPSLRAATRLGFSFEGLFRQHMIVKGRNRDTAWYAIIDQDWPAIRKSFEAWLDPANFDPHGGQRRKLAAREAAGVSPVVLNRQSDQRL